MSTVACQSLLSVGIDVGTSSVKTVVLRDGGKDRVEILSIRTDRIRKRDLRAVIEESFSESLTDAQVERDDIVYIASTGEGQLVDFRRGHFYGMTTHARGAQFLMPAARAVLDVGALHARTMRIDENSRVLGYRMTNQCASGSGQFLENVARYLGVPLEEVGALSVQSSDPETVSSICAVLAETDVINMVSRGIATEDILKGIHLSMASRYVRLLKATGADGVVAMTGGLSLDIGLRQAIVDMIEKENLSLTLQTHESSIHAGALGAALWGSYRHRVLERRAARSP